MVSSTLNKGKNNTKLFGNIKEMIANKEIIDYAITNFNENSQMSCMTHESQALSLIDKKTGDLFCIQCIFSNKKTVRPNVIQIKDLETNFNYLKGLKYEIAQFEDQISKMLDLSEYNKKAYERLEVEFISSVEREFNVLRSILNERQGKVCAMIKETFLSKRHENEIYLRKIIHMKDFLLSFHKRCNEKTEEVSYLQIFFKFVLGKLTQTNVGSIKPMNNDMFSLTFPTKTNTSKLLKEYCLFNQFDLNGPGPRKSQAPVKSGKKPESHSKTDSSEILPSFPMNEEENPKINQATLEEKKQETEEKIKNDGNNISSMSPRGGGTSQMFPDESFGDKDTDSERKKIPKGHGTMVLKKLATVSKALNSGKQLLKGNQPQTSQANKRAAENRSKTPDLSGSLPRSSKDETGIGRFGFGMNSFRGVQLTPRKNNETEGKRKETKGLQKGGTMNPRENENQKRQNENNEEKNPKSFERTVSFGEIP